MVLISWMSALRSAPTGQHLLQPITHIALGADGKPYPTQPWVDRNKQADLCCATGT